MLGRQPIMFATLLVASAAHAQTVTTCPVGMVREPEISANEECNPNMSETKSCDARYKSSSQEWQDCYEKVKACRRDVEARNAVIRKNNVEFARVCPKGKTSANRKPVEAKAPKVNNLGTPVQPNKSVEPDYSAVKAKIEAARQKAANPVSEKAALDKMRTETERSATDYYKEELIRERKKLEEDLRKQEANKAKIREQIRQSEENNTIRWPACQGDWDNIVSRGYVCDRWGWKK